MGLALHSSQRSDHSQREGAAQVAVQRVHEDWLHRNQKRFNVPRFSYQWKEIE
jgi:hypothetical protein